MMKTTVFFSVILALEAVQINENVVLRSSITPETIDREEIGANLQHRVTRAAAPTPTTSTVTANCPALKKDNHRLAIVHWSGQTGTKVSEMFFILTVQRNSKQISTESTLWRSTDYGDNFLNDSSKVDNTALDYYYINSLNNKMIIFTALTARKLYVTQDEGKTYTAVSLTFRPNDIWFNPTDVNTVLAYDSSGKEIHVSTDSGLHWTQVATNASDRYFWENLKGHPGGTLYFEKLVGSKSKIFVATPPYASNNVKQFQAASTPSLLFDQYSMVMTNEYMISQTTDSSGSGTMYTSYRRGPFKLAQFPFKDRRKEKDYLLVDGSEGQLFIAVNHRSNLTSLYMSEKLGISFSLTVDDVLTNSDRSWQIHRATVYMYKLAGIRGTYFVNQHKPDRSLTTIVTFDKGATWNPVTAPATDLNGRDTNCFQPTCSLQMSSRGIFSRSTAIGLVWAQGNVGSNLRASAGTFLSRDGGKTWRWVFQSYYQASFADQGAVMAAARIYRFTSSIQHSCNEGVTWQSYNIEKKINVIGVLTEPGEKSLSISAFGFETGYKEWIVCKLNFSKILKTPCDQSQYYQWAPSDERVGRSCLLGELRVYQRRKADVCCYNGRQNDLPVNVTSCGCAAEDFECDFGYERDDYDSPCVPSTGTIVPGPPSNCSERKSYNLTQGYRKVAGDNCVGGDENHFLYKQLPCPVDPPLGLQISVLRSPVQVGENIQFKLEQASGGSVTTTYTWDFNDGTSTQTFQGLKKTASVFHSFAKAGLYNVKVTGTNSGGRSATVLSIQAYDVLRKEDISVTQSDGITEKSITAFSATLSKNFNYGKLQFTWMWGDNTAAITTDEPFAEHAYQEAGSYQASVTVKSALFETELYTVQFTVAVSPSATAIVEHQVESKKKTVTVAVAVSVVFIVVIALLAVGIYYYRKRYGRLEVAYSQLKASGRGNYVFGGDGGDEDNTIGEEDSESNTTGTVTMSALTDE